MSTSVFNPIVSICCQTYNHEKYIRKCLMGFVLQETNFLFEILVHDDASNDCTAIIVKEFEEKYPNLFRCVYQTENQFKKQNTLTNILFPMAKGRYIALCEGDDYWTDPSKLQKQFDLLETNPDLILCHHWQEIAEPDGKGKFKIMPAPTKGHGYFPQTTATVKDIFSNRLRIKTRTMMFRNVLSSFPAWFHKAQFGDVPLTMLLGKYGKFGFIDQAMAVYRITGKGISVSGSDRNNYLYTHYCEWIKIWELGLIHYEYEYQEEGFTTIVHFYKKILYEYHGSVVVILRLMLRSLIKSELSVDRRMMIFNQVFVRAIFNRLAQISIKFGHS